MKFLTILNVIFFISTVRCQNSVLSILKCFEDKEISLNEHQYVLDLLLVVPSTPEYLLLSHQTPGLCLALAQSKIIFPQISSRKLRIFYYVASEDGAKTYDELKPLLDDDRYTFTGILGPNLVQDLDNFLSSSELGGLTAISYGQTIMFRRTFNPLVPKDFIVYQTNPDDAFSVTPVYKNLFNEYNWNRVAIFYQSEKYYLHAVAEELRNEFTEEGYETEFVAVDSQAGNRALDKMVADLGPAGSDFRIFILLLNDDYASKVLCEFYSNNMYGPLYFLFGQVFWDAENWHSTMKTECSSENFLSVLDYAIFIEPSGISWLNKSFSDSQLCPQEFEKRLDSVFNDSGADAIPHFYDSGFVADAVWVLLQAVDQALAKLFPETEWDKQKSEFYSNIAGYVSQTSFTGVSGTISFGTSGQREMADSFAIYQQLEGKLELVGKSDTLDNVVFENTIEFREGTIPDDNNMMETIDIELADMFIIFMSLSALVFCFVSIVLFYEYRAKPAIKLQSPKINILCGFGCSLSLIAIFSHIFFNRSRKVRYSSDPTVHNSKNNWECVLFHVAYYFGFCLAFVCLIAKQFRIYKIFTTKVRKMVLIDKMLILYCLGIASFYALVVLASFALKNVEYVYIYVGTSSCDPKVAEKPEFFVICSKPKNIIFFSTYAIDLALIYFAAYFAWNTRNVRIRMLNDSQKIGSLLVTGLSLCIMHNLMIFLFKSHMNTVSVFFMSTANAILIIWMILLQTFLPGLITLIRNPDCQPDTSLLSSNFGYRSQILSNPDENVAKLESIEQLLVLYKRTHEMWKDLHENQEQIEHGEKERLLNGDR